MKSTQSFNQIIKNHLDQRAKDDNLFAASYAKKNKSIDECCNYIFREAKKKGSAVFMKDDEVYGLAVHYYDEDDIKNVQPIKSVSVSSSAPVTTSQPVPKMKVIKNKKVADSRQMSLF